MNRRIAIMTALAPILAPVALPVRRMALRYRIGRELRSLTRGMARATQTAQAFDNSLRRIGKSFVQVEIRSPTS